MDNEIIRQIHRQDGKFVLAITGGGASAVTRLLAVPGASNTLLSATIPYHDRELASYLGGNPEAACSSNTARSLAMVSWLRARKLEQSVPVYGLGCTAALATNRQRRGDDRCYVAIQSAESTTEIAVTFDKSGRDREEEENLCSSLVLGLIAGTLDINVDFLSGFRQSDIIAEKQKIAEPSWQALIGGDTKVTREEDPPVLAFPGAFNPIHQGHVKMIEYAEKLTGEKVTLEISIFNVDKPPLDFIEMQSRHDALQNWPLMFSNAPTFLEKCRLFPGATFMVGIDTLKRMVEPKYYDSSEDKRDQALQEISNLENRFIVFGRKTAEGFVSLDDLDLPTVLSDNCVCVTQEDFREDISSTEKRAG